MRSEPTRSARSQRTQFIVAAFVPALILLLCVTGFVWAQKQVSVVVDGRTLHIDSQSADVAGLLSETGVKVGAGDLVFPSQDTKVTAGMSVVVRHAVPVVVVLGGTDTSLNVVGKTVADALVAAGLDPEATAGVTPALDAPLKPGMRITAPDSFARISTVTTNAPFAVAERPDGTLPKGVRRIIRHGSVGSVMRIYRSLVVSGIEGSSTLTAENVVVKPVTEVVAVGTGDGSTRRQLAVAHISAQLIRASTLPQGRHINVIATAYSAEEPGASSGTATGPRCERGIVAVDPNVIPLGSHLYVPGYGYAIAGDTGGMINGRHIDLCFNSLFEVNSWGKRHVTIVVLD
ncbi:MAG: 3D domain-containing protein [Coriobacteriia bacterium]|nr:3D domain-containing protein [Coriobacteriia bacterium]